MTSSRGVRHRSPRGLLRTDLRPQLCSADLHYLDSTPADRWVWEIKYDGWRALLHPPTGTLLSRHGRNLAPAFPDLLACALRVLADRDIVLDGELVVLDPDGRPDFSKLTSRGQSGALRAQTRAGATPVVLVAFDLLVLDGQDLRDQPWTQRRAALESLDLPQELAPGVCALICAATFDNGPELIRATHDLRLEGVVAKDRTAPYRAGRTRSWIKVKHPHARDLN